MDPTSLIPILEKAGAPLIAGAIKTAAGAAGGPVAGAIADIAVDAVGKAMGLNTSDPGAIANAIQNDPTKAAAVLPTVDADHAELIKAQGDVDAAHLADIQNARSQALALVQAKSPMAWGSVVVSVLIVVCFMGALVILLKGGVNLNETAGQAILIIIGGLSAAFGQTVNFWLGSSSGSADKSAILSQVALQSRPVPPPAVPVMRKR
jgi:hypothetical protein